MLRSTPTGRGRRRARQLTRLDAIGPVGERREVPAVRGQHRRHEPHHVAACGARLNAARPGADRIVKVTERFGDVPRRVVADLMAIAAAIGLGGIEPLILGLEVHPDAVAVGAGAGEAAAVRNADHRGPIDRRIILRGLRKAWRDDRGEVERLAGLGRDLGRVDEAVAAHPDPVGRLGQVGDHIASVIVGDRHLGETRTEFGCLSHHPDACLRADAARDDAADVVAVD